VTTVAYAPNGNYLVTGGDDNKVKIWTPSGTLLHTCLGHSGDITNVKVTPDNLYVVSSSKDSSIKVWDISNGTLIKTITGHNDAVNGIAVSPDGLQIASASADGSCKVWDFSTTSQLFSFGEPDSNALNTAAWSSISNKIVTGSINSDVTLWDVSTPSDFKKMKNELEFALFPNPTAHFIQLYVSDIERIKSIQITSPSGKVVYLSSIFTNSISIDEWASGQYIVTLTSKNDKSISKTILISR
jgi:WD40 repeat protein